MRFRRQPGCAARRRRPPPHQFADAGCLHQPDVRGDALGLRNRVTPCSPSCTTATRRRPKRSCRPSSTTPTSSCRVLDAHLPVGPPADRRGAWTYLAETDLYRRVADAIAGSFPGHATRWPRLADRRRAVVDELHVASVEVHAFGAITPIDARAFARAAVRVPVDGHQPLPGPWRPARVDPPAPELLAAQAVWLGWLVAIMVRRTAASTSKPTSTRSWPSWTSSRATSTPTRTAWRRLSMTVRVSDKTPEHRRGSCAHGGEPSERCRPAARASLPSRPRWARSPTSPATPAPIWLTAASRRSGCRPSAAARRLTGLTTGYREDLHLKGPALMVAHSRRRGPLFWPLHAPGVTSAMAPVSARPAPARARLSSDGDASTSALSGSTVTIFDKRRSSMVMALCQR